MVGGGVGHPGVHRLERPPSEPRIVDRARQGVAGAGDQVLVRDPDLVHPGDAGGGIGHGLELVGPGIAHSLRSIRVEHELHQGRDQLVDRHPLLARHVAEQVVGHEVGEHLAGVHAKARVGVGQELGKLRLQGRELLEPVRRGFEVRVDIHDRSDGGMSAAHFIIPPETERSSPVTNDDASLIR